MKRFAVLAVGLAAVGCSKEKEETKVDPPSSLFAEGDLDAGTSASVSASEIGGRVGSVAVGLSRDDEVGLDLQDEDAAEACVTKKLDALAFSADKANGLIDATVDIKDCKLADDEETTFDYETAEVQVRAWFGCQNDDIQDLDGHLWSDSKGAIPAFDYCKSEESVELLLNAVVHLRASLPEEGHTITIDGRNTLAVQTKDGGPCSARYADGNWTWDDACVHVEKVKVDASVDGSAVELDAGEYTRAEYKSLVESHDPHPWFESGSVALQYNNWSGTITYDGGNTPPTYDVTDGVVTKQGTVSEYGLVARSMGRTIAQKLKKRP